MVTERGSVGDEVVLRVARDARGYEVFGSHAGCKRTAQFVAVRREGDQGIDGRVDRAQGPLELPEYGVARLPRGFDARVEACELRRCFVACDAMKARVVP